MAIPIFSVTNRGLEPISAEEMRRVESVQVGAITYRRVEAAVSGDLKALLSLRTVDDVFLKLAEWEGIPTQRAGLAALTERSQMLPLANALQVIADVRRVHVPPAFSVTANFVGKRKYTMEEIKTAVAEGINARFNWQYTTEDASEINVRVFIEHDTAYVGARLGDTSLHRRPYKQEHVSGSLKPPVAAAMLFMAGVVSGVPAQRMLDPFCGAGTILIEAAMTGTQAAGGDIDVEAIRAAVANAKLARLRLPLHRWDAQRLPLADRSVERIVTNPPWGQQVQVDNALKRFYRDFCREFARVLEPGGQIVLLTSLPELVRVDGLKVQEAVEISLFGMTPSILRLGA